jgi:ferredoxin
MKLHVDAAKCEGYGTCASIAPDLFTLDEWGYAEPTGDGTVDAGRQDAARQAAAECPMHAIAIITLTD